MSTFVILVILGSALFHATWNAIIKGGTDKLFETVMKTSGGGIVVACILPFLPPPHPSSWPYLAATATIHLFYYLFMAYAYKGADLSYAYPIMRGSSPLLVALVSVFFLSKPLTAGGWAGVALLSAGILTLAADSIRRGSFSLSATLFAVGNAFVIMGYTLVDGTGVRLAGDTLSYTCWVFFLNAFPILAFAVAARGPAYFHYARQRWQYGLVGGTCSLIAYGLSLWGMSRAPVSLVAALRESSVVFGVLLGVFFLKEKITFARGAAVLLVIAGISAIKLWG